MALVAAIGSPRNQAIVKSRRNRNKCRTPEKLDATISCKMQNTSHAVMAQRTELKNSLDDFPTPPWATRALIEHVVISKDRVRSMTCLEPACGRGHMSVTLAEYFDKVVSLDVFDYGFGPVADFIELKHPDGSFDWVITNPPFPLGEEFIRRSMKIARHGVAMLTRTVFIESVGRYERIFIPNRPSRFAQFTERVPMVKGRIDKKASTATGYAWLIWEFDRLGSSELVWVPPCRKALERDGDYEQAPRVKICQKPASITAIRTHKSEDDLFQRRLSF